MFATPAAARQAAREIRKQVAELRRDKKAALVDIATSCTLTRTRTGNAMKALRKAAAELVKARKAELVTQRKAACDKTPKAKRAKAAAVKRAEEALAQAETAAAVIAGEAAAATMPAAVEAALIEAEAPALVPIWRELAPAITPEQAATVPDAVELLVEYVKQNPADVAAAIERSGEAIAAEIEAPAPPPPGALSPDALAEPWIPQRVVDVFLSVARADMARMLIPVGEGMARAKVDGLLATMTRTISKPPAPTVQGVNFGAIARRALQDFLERHRHAARRESIEGLDVVTWIGPRKELERLTAEAWDPPWGDVRQAMQGLTPPKAAPPAPAPAPPQPGGLAALGVELQPLPREAVLAAYRNTSHTPEKRADSTEESYRAELEGFAAELVSRASAEDLPALGEKFRAFVDGYRSRVLAALAADAKTASAMIVGPSKFPTERNRKALEVARKRWEEVREFRENGKRRLLKEVTGRVGISSDDPNAPDALRAKLAELEERDQEIEEIKRVASDRKLSTAERKARLIELGLPGFQAETGATRGWAPLQFLRSNLRQEIARVKERIAQIERKRSESTSEVTVTYDGKPVRVVDDVAANRLQIFFQGKPSPATIARLKERGFKWAPSVGAWQRFRSEQAKYQAGQVLNHSMDALGKAPVVDRTEPVISAEVDARRVGELRAMLTAAGYRGELAEQLASEGVGAEELAKRLRVRPGDVGSLEFTHGAQRRETPAAPPAAPPAPPPDESLEDRVSPADELRELLQGIELTDETTAGARAARLTQVLGNLRAEISGLPWGDPRREALEQEVIQARRVNSALGTYLDDRGKRGAVDQMQRSIAEILGRQLPELPGPRGEVEVEHPAPSEDHLLQGLPITRSSLQFLEDVQRHYQGQGPLGEGWNVIRRGWDQQDQVLYPPATARGLRAAIETIKAELHQIEDAHRSSQGAEARELDRLYRSGELIKNRFERLAMDLEGRRADPEFDELQEALPAWILTLTRSPLGWKIIAMPRQLRHAQGVMFETVERSDAIAMLVRSMLRKDTHSPMGDRRLVHFATRYSEEPTAPPALPPPPAPPPPPAAPPSAAQVERAREAIERALAGGPLEHAALHRRVDPAASHAATDQALEQLEAAALVERLDQGGELHYRRTTPARPAEGFRPAATPGQTGALFEEVEPAPLPAELAALGVPVRFQGDALAGYLIAPELVDAASNVIPVPVDSEAARHFDRPDEMTGNEDDAARQGLVLVQLGPPMNEDDENEAEELKDNAAEYAESGEEERHYREPYREFFPVMWDHGQPLSDPQKDALAVGTVRAVRVLGVEPVKALARKGVFFSPYDSPFAPRSDWSREVPAAELRQAGVFGLFPVVIDIARALAEGGPAGAERRRKEAEEDDAAAVASYHQQEQKISALEERIAEIKTRSQPIPHLSFGGNFKITGRLPRVEYVGELNDQRPPPMEAGPGYVLASLDGVRLVLMARTRDIVLTTLDNYPIVRGNTLAQGVYLLENFAPFFRAAKSPDLVPLQRIRSFWPRELAQKADPLTMRLYELVGQSAELPTLYHWPNPGYVRPLSDNRGAWPRYQGKDTTAEQLGEMGPHVELGTAQGGVIGEVGVAVWEQHDGFCEFFIKVRISVYGETGPRTMHFAPPELLPTQQIPGRRSSDVILRIAPSFNELRPFLEQLLAHYFPELVRNTVSAMPKEWGSLHWKSAPDLVSYWRSAWSGYGERLPDALAELEAERHRDRIKDTSLPGFARPGQKIVGPWGASAGDGRVMAWRSDDPAQGKQWRYGAKLEPFRSLVAEAVKNTLNATKGQGDWSLLTWGVAGYLNEALLKKDPAQKWIVAAHRAPKSDPEALGTLEPLDLIERDGAFSLTRVKPGAFGLTWLPSGANATTLHTNERAAKQVFRTLAPKIERSTKDDWNDREANRFRVHGWNKISGDVIGGIVKTTEEQLKSAAASKKAESKAATEKGAEELAILNLNRFVDERLNPPDDNTTEVTAGKYEIRARWSYQLARRRDPDRSHDLAFGTIELRERPAASRELVWRARFLFDMGPGAAELHHLLKELLRYPSRYMTGGALDDLVKAIKSHGSDGTEGALKDSPKATAQMGRELLGLAVGLYTRTSIPKEAPYALVLAPTAELKPDEAPPGFQGVTTLYGATFYGMPVKGEHFGVNRDNGLASLDLGGSFGLKVPKHAKTVVAKLDAAFPEPLIYGMSELREGMLNVIPAFGQNPQAALDAWAAGKPLRTSNPAGNGGDSSRARCQAARDEIRAVELDQRALLARLLEIKRHELTEARVAACEAPRAALRKKFDAKIDKLLREARDLEQTARDMTRTALPPLSKATSDSLIEATLGAVEPRLVPLWRELASKIEAPTASGRMEAFLAYARDHESDAQRAQKTDPDTADLPPVQLDEGAGDEPQAPPGDLLDELQAAMPDWSITVKPTSNDHTRWFASAVYQKTSKKAPKVEHSASAPTRARALGRLIRQWIFKGGGATVDERRRLKAIWDRRVDVRTENPSSPDPEDVVLSAALVAELLGLGLAQARETGPRFASFVEDYLDRRTGGAGFRVVWASRGPEQLSDAANRQSIERILRDAARAWRSQDPDDWSELDDASSNPSGGHEREVFERETASMVGWANAELPGFLRRYQPRRTGIFLRGGSSFTRYMDDARRSFEARYPGEPLTVAARMFQQARGIVGAMQHDSLGAVSYGIKMDAWDRKAAELLGRSPNPGGGDARAARVWIEDGKVKVQAPFALPFQRRALQLGGRWNASARHWFFPESEAARVRSAVREVYDSRTANPCGCGGQWRLG